MRLCLNIIGFLSCLLCCASCAEVYSPLRYGVDGDASRDSIVLVQILDDKTTFDHPALRIHQAHLIEHANSRAKELTDSLPVGKYNPYGPYGFHKTEFVKVDDQWAKHRQAIKMSNTLVLTPGYHSISFAFPGLKEASGSGGRTPDDPGDAGQELRVPLERVHEGELEAGHVYLAYGIIRTRSLGPGLLDTRTEFFFEDVTDLVDWDSPAAP